MKVCARAVVDSAARAGSSVVNRIVILAQQGREICSRKCSDLSQGEWYRARCLCRVVRTVLTSDKTGMYDQTRKE